MEGAETAETDSDMLNHIMYSTVTFIFGVAVLIKYFRNELRVGVRSIAAMFVLFVGEPMCQFGIGGHNGLAIYVCWCLITYIALPANHIDIDGKAVLITGCDSGLGNALTQYLDERGFQVFAGCLDKERKGAIQLASLCSDKLTLLQLDVTNEEEIQQALQVVQEKLQGQGLWGLVNNAGVFSFMDIELTPMCKYRDLLEVNCLGVVRMVQVFLPLIRQTKGRIVNISSTYGRVPLMGMSAYNISKAGVEIFTDVLRQEMKKWQIKVSVVQPYGFLTACTARDKMETAYQAMMNDLSPQMKQLYGTQYFKMYYREIVQQEGRTLRSTESLSEDSRFLCRCVRDALLSKRPQARYPEGPGARLAMILADHLPDTVLDFCLPYLLPAWARIQPSRL
ncbi:retinol dehydrogenase 7-like [Ptychodera flava]|uniref:retinol dehydrogenase 7-like n=1 Tax=Ptychodera flava TaxID=63121 RepID=UPI003969CCAD